MQPDLEKRMSELENKVDAIYESVEKTRKILMWTGIITIAVIILPIIAMMFVIPSFIGNYTTTLETLGM